jgi:hypothetical protein
MNLDEAVTNLNSRLVSDEIFSKHREVVFVCHSLGGLIVQRLLLTFRQYTQQVPFIYFFSTPETGAQIANLGSVFSSDPLLKAMFVGDENGYLQNLENEWKASQFHIHRLCAYEKKKYKGVLVVDRLSGTRNCDEPPIALNEDHVGIVKPNSAEHDSYIALRNAVLKHPISRRGQQASPIVAAKRVGSKPTFVFLLPDSFDSAVGTWTFVAKLMGKRATHVELILMSRDLTDRLAGADADRLSRLTAINQYGVQASAVPAEVQASLYGTGTGGSGSQLSTAADAAKTPSFWDQFLPAIAGGAGAAAAGFRGGGKVDLTGIDMSAGQDINRLAVVKGG